MTGRLCSLLALLGGLAVTSAASAQRTGARDEAVAVQVSPSATRQLATAVNLLQSGEWDSALQTLQDLEARSPEALVEVEPRRAIRADLATQLLRAQLPANRLGAERARADALARDWYDEALLTDDPSLLQRILDRAASSSWSESACERLAHLAWRRGQLDRAAAHWKLLRPVSEPPAIDPAAPLQIAASRLSAADLLARRTLLEAFAGDRLRARDLLTEFETRFPDASGEIAGKQGQLRELLEEAIATDAARPLTPPHIWQTGGSVSRNAVSAVPPAELTPVWRMPTSRIALSGTARPLREPTSQTAGLPVLWEGRLLLQEPGQLLALKTKTGRPAWPTGAARDSGAFWYTPEGEPGQLTLPVQGVPLRAPAISGSRGFALTGPQIAWEASQEPRAIESQLICFDLREQEGKLLWSLTPIESLPDAGWRFSGPPLAVGDRVFITTRRAAPQPEVGIACYDGADGTLIWFQTVCGLLATVPRRVHLVTGDLLAADGERLFLANDFGATVCVRQSTGALQWIQRDPPLPWRPPGAAPDLGIAGRSAVCHRGWVYSVRQDDATIQQLDAHTGAIAWERTVGSRVSQLIGAHGGVLIAAGDHLWGLAEDTGEIRWRAGFDDPEGAICGRGLIAGRSVLACTRDELLGVDLLTGALLRRVPLREAWGLEGGHLATAGDWLILSTPGELVGFQSGHSPPSR